jgi:hypothetical protein
MKKIIVKEIDKFHSTLFKDKIVTEYLIYYIEGNRKKAFTEMGEQARDSRLGKLLDEYCELDDNSIYHDIIIEFVKFENYKNQ